jgi:hypothetical protein
MLGLMNVTTIKNRLDELIEYQEDEANKIESLITMCEMGGAIKTAQTLRIMLSDEVVELTNLENMKKTFEREEARLLSINPEVRYPLVSERYGAGELRGHYTREPHRRAYTVRDSRKRY